MMMKKSMLAAACAAGMFAAEAKVQLGVPFTDGVVLQRLMEEMQVSARTGSWVRSKAGEIHA